MTGKTTASRLVIIGAGAQIIGPITVGKRARVGANAVVTEDVPDGATMVGPKARSTLVKAETWAKDFIPYGTPCKEGGEPAGPRIEGLEAEVAVLLNIEGMSAQNLYVAMTRGSMKLVVCSTSPVIG